MNNLKSFSYTNSCSDSIIIVILCRFIFVLFSHWFIIFHDKRKKNPISLYSLTFHLKTVIFNCVSYVNRNRYLFLAIDEWNNEAIQYMSVVCLCKITKTWPTANTIQGAGLYQSSRWFTPSEKGTGLPNLTLFLWST